MENKIKTIVCGCGRSGTVFMARLLTSMGIPCGHESVFNLCGDTIFDKLNQNNFKLSVASSVDLLTNKPIEQWVDSNEIIADSSYMAAPYLSHILLKDIKIIHVVRHPIKVISSFVLDGGYFIDSGSELVIHYENYIYKWLPELKKIKAGATRAAAFYIKWNEMIERQKGAGYYFYKIEERPNQELFKFIGYTPNGEKLYDNKINSWLKRSEDIKLNEIEQPERMALTKMAVRYGYDVSQLL